MSCTFTATICGRASSPTKSSLFALPRIEPGALALSCTMPTRSWVRWKSIRNDSLHRLMRRTTRALVASMLLLGCRGAAAHSMGVIYNLPIPFWMYAFAASAALALSFLVVGFFVSVQNAQRNFRSLEFPVPRAVSSGAVLAALRVLSVFLLLLT